MTITYTLFFIPVSTFGLALAPGFGCGFPFFCGLLGTPLFLDGAGLADGLPYEGECSSFLLLLTTGLCTGLIALKMRL